MVPAPIEVSVLPLIVPGPETILNIPPVGVPVSVRVFPLHMGALLLVMMGKGVWFETMLCVVVPVHPFCVTLYCIIMVPAPVAVSIFPLILPGPEMTLNDPPVGVPVKALVVPLHIGELLLVIVGAGVKFETMLCVAVPAQVTYWITIVPPPVAVSTELEIVPGPLTILNVPPVGVPVSILVVPEHIGELLLVITVGSGPSQPNELKRFSRGKTSNVARIRVF